MKKGDNFWVVKHVEQEQESWTCKRLAVQINLFDLKYNLLKEAGAV